MSNSKLDNLDLSLDAANHFAEAASTVKDRHVKRQLLLAGCSVLEYALGLNNSCRIGDEATTEHSPAESARSA